MDWTTLGIEALLVAAIIAGTKILTAALDPGKLAERWYPLLPILLAIPVAILRWWGSPWPQIALKVFIYGFIAGHAYKTGKTSVLGQ